jgi:hypothetical protein
MTIPCHTPRLVTPQYRKGCGEFSSWLNAIVNTERVLAECDASHALRRCLRALSALSAARGAEPSRRARGDDRDPADRAHAIRAHLRRFSLALLVERPQMLERKFALARLAAIRTSPGGAFVGFTAVGAAPPAILGLESWLVSSM